MSRSYKKTPIHSITGSRCSEAWDKKKWHRRLRVHERSAMSDISIHNSDRYMYTHHYQVSNLWDMSKDGKAYWSPKDRLKVALRLAEWYNISADQLRKYVLRELYRGARK